MPVPEHEAYQAQLVAALRALARDPDRHRVILQLAPTILVLYHLDLTPAAPILASGYAPSPHGGVPWSPVPMLRAVLLGHLSDCPSLHRLSARLRGCPVLVPSQGSRPRRWTPTPL